MHFVLSQTVGVKRDTRKYERLIDTHWTKICFLIPNMQLVKNVKFTIGHSLLLIFREKKNVKSVYDFIKKHFRWYKNTVRAHCGM
jgi:hypothetical protein